MSLLAGFRMVQLGPGLAAAVCGRLLADLGAEVACGAAAGTTPLEVYLGHGKAILTDQLATADLIIVEGSPAELHARGHDPAGLRRHNATAALVLISPFGQTGPDAEHPATDLTLCFASGIAKLLTGQVDDLAEPPIRPVGQQSAFIGGLAAACAGMHAVQAGEPGAVMDVSIQEALATLAITELTAAGLHGRTRNRKRISDGNGATVTILPSRDGYVAISPREERQWAAWLTVMGSPEWGNEPRFARKTDRVANFDALHALMSDWSRQHDKQWIADAAQAAHVPSFPLREPAEQLASPQLAHREFYRPLRVDGHPVQAPGQPFGLRLSRTAQVAAPTASKLPLAGVRVLDFSWVIAGPTTTRYLAAMGADVIKVEAPGRGDPGRASELHTVLGQAKRAIVLDLKRPEAVELARGLAAKSDVLVENFATGVMDRLGLGDTALQAINPALVYVSASGLGRTGPEAQAVAYGTLLQCYAGFAGLNRHPEIPPRVGLAWLDPMCGLKLAFIVAAALWQRRRSGVVARVDFSMIEAMLWTMAEPLLATQLGAPPRAQGDSVYRCAGRDEWISLAVRDDADWRRLCALVPGLTSSGAALAAWLLPQSAQAAAATLVKAGIPAAPLAGSLDLVASDHLRERGFWDRNDSGVVPGLPWRASFGRANGVAPGLGADTDAVLGDVLDLSPDAIADLRRSGVFG